MRGMKRMKALGAVAAVIMASACMSASMGRRTAVQARLDEPFQLPRGQVADIAGQRLTVAFTSVESDSRCPANVQCVRAGEARVHVELRQLGRQPEDVVLATEGAQPRYATYGAYDVHLVTLEP